MTDRSSVDVGPGTLARAAILALIDERGAGRTICPSEAARRLSPTDWRTLMRDVHTAAALLEREGVIRATWRSRSVALAPGHGPYRLQRAGALADAPDTAISDAC